MCVCLCVYICLCGGDLNYLTFTSSSMTNANRPKNQWGDFKSIFIWSLSPDQWIFKGAYFIAFRRVHSENNSWNSWKYGIMMKFWSKTHSWISGLLLCTRELLCIIFNHMDARVKSVRISCSQFFFFPVELFENDCISLKLSEGKVGKDGSIFSVNKRGLSRIQSPSRIHMVYHNSKCKLV